MKRLSILCALLLAGAFTGDTRGSDRRHATAICESLREVAGLPSLAVAVGVDGEIAWSTGFGPMGREDDSPVDGTTRYRIGSISKMLTVALLARLVEEELLDLDEPIQSYLADFPEKDHPVTARQLSGHLAGIRHYAAKDFFPENINQRHYDSLHDGLEIFADDDLLFEPGTAYQYTSFGYNLLGVVAAEAGADEFRVLLRDQVLLPLGMDSTCADDIQDEIDRRTELLKRGAGRLLPADEHDPSYKWPSGGYLSTAEDLVRFGNAHVEPGFLSAEMLELLFTSQQLNDGTATGVGIGWRIAKDRAGRRVIHHSGSISGGRGTLVLYPDQDVVVTLLTNLSGARFAQQEAMLVAEAFLDPEKRPAPAAGTFSLKGTHGDQPLEGTVELVNSEGFTSGTAALDPHTIPIRSARSTSVGMDLVLAHPDGYLLVARLTAAPDGAFSGSIESFDGNSGTITLTRGSE